VQPELETLPTPAVPNLDESLQNLQTVTSEAVIPETTPVVETVPEPAPVAEESIFPAEFFAAMESLAPEPVAVATPEPEAKPEAKKEETDPFVDFAQLYGL
jgi:hypothetical protein